VLSVILPVRCGPANEYLLDRLAANLKLLCAHPDVECVVVDSASPAPYAERIRRVCDRERCRVIVDPAPQEPFAPGLTRNAGASHATGELLLFYDVDLCCGSGFVDEVLAALGASPVWNGFLVIPSLFLTREATERIAFTGDPVDLQPALASMLAGDNDIVANVAFTHLAIARSHFLRMGGNRPEYRGHGCEDFDLLHRLASHRPLGKRPADYYTDVRTMFPGDYGGFRAYLARYALPHLFTGPYTAHLWHSRPIRRRYFRRRHDNEALLQQFMHRHDAGDDPVPRAQDPLPVPWQDEGAEEPPPIGDFLTELMARHGLTVATHPGLFRWRAGVQAPRGTATARLRKLIMRPREFFADSRLRSMLPFGRRR